MCLDGMTVVRRSRTIIFDLYGTLLPGGSRLRRDTIAFQMADVLEVDRKKLADVVRDTFCLLYTSVIDAAKVTRSALQNAASIAALFLTTECVIVDKPEEKVAAMPGGGMDDY